MPKKEVPVQTLEAYLPADTYPYVAEYLHRYGIHLTVTKARQSILGDYRPAIRDMAHRISVNGNLNPYAFLLTLLHEMAHLVVYEQYGRKVMPHGKEWQSIFSELLSVFIKKSIFPSDIKEVLIKTIHKPAASSCGEEALMRVLQRYDGNRTNKIRVEELLQGQQFKLEDGRVFIKGPKLRKRHKAIEHPGGSVYLFSGIYLVQKI
jgi:SprT protein